MNSKRGQNATKKNHEWKLDGYWQIRTTNILQPPHDINANTQEIVEQVCCTSDNASNLRRTIAPMATRQTTPCDVTFSFLRLSCSVRHYFPCVHQSLPVIIGVCLLRGPSNSPL